MTDSNRRSAVPRTSLKAGVTTGSSENVAIASLSALTFIGSRDAHNATVAIDLTSAPAELIEMTERNIRTLNIKPPHFKNNHGLIEFDTIGTTALIKAKVKAPVLDAIKSWKSIPEIAAISLSQLTMAGKTDGQQPEIIVTFPEQAIRLVYDNMDKIGTRKEGNVEASGSNFVTFNTNGIQAMVKAGVNSPILAAMQGIKLASRAL